MHSIKNIFTFKKIFVIIIISNVIKKQYHVEDFQMDNREVIYVVTYLDDRNQKHLITVKGFSAVRFLEERYGRVFYEVTENYVREE